MIYVQKLWIVTKIIRSWDKTKPFTCPACGAPIQFRFNDGGRRIVFLSGAKMVVTNNYGCTRKACVNHGHFTMAPILALPGKKYGLDVWEKVISWHFKLGRNYAEIAGQLLEDYHLKIHKGTIRLMCQFFEIAGATEADKETLAAVLKNGKIILSLDATGDNDGGPGLWIFSDRLTGRVLYADIIEHATVEALGAIIQQIQAKYPVPISHVMSDRQDTIVLTVERFLPGIPHAFCHYHFLENLAKPVAAKDSDLLAKLKKRSESSTWCVLEENLGMENQ